MTPDEQERLRVAEAAISQMKVELAELKAQLSQNTAATLAVKADTAEIVALMKGFKVVAWMAKAVAAIGGAWAAGKGLKWW